MHSKAEIKTIISNLIDNADVNLDTLNEIANAIKHDPVFLSQSGINSGFRDTCSTIK